MSDPKGVDIFKWRNKDYMANLSSFGGYTNLAVFATGGNGGGPVARANMSRAFLSHLANAALAVYKSEGDISKSLLLHKYNKEKEGNKEKSIIVTIEKSSDKPVPYSIAFQIPEYQFQAQFFFMKDNFIQLTSGEEDPRGDSAVEFTTFINAIKYNHVSVMESISKGSVIKRAPKPEGKDAPAAKTPPNDDIPF